MLQMCLVLNVFLLQKNVVLLPKKPTTKTPNKQNKNLHTLACLKSIVKRPWMMEYAKKMHTPKKKERRNQIIRFQVYLHKVIQDHEWDDD